MGICGVLCQSLFLLCPYMEIPDVINIKPISWNAHIWTYCVSLMWSMMSDIYDVSHLHIWEQLMF